MTVATPVVPTEPRASAAESRTRRKEQQPRITVIGNTVAAPFFRTTPRGVFVGGFRMGEHTDDTTIYHHVVAFGDQAERLQNLGLGKGDLVEVTGYVHETKRRGQDGKRTKVQQIYAVVIKPR